VETYCGSRIQKQMILASTCMLQARILGYILAVLILLFAYLDSSIASDILRIETILASPSSYAQHDVTLRDKARQIRKAEPYSCSKTYCGRSTVAYEFILEDDTATIGISVPCSCFGETSIHDGQTLIAIVSIRVIERGDVQPVVVGVAHRILPSPP
jgi:hypothetical protein